MEDEEQSSGGVGHEVMSASDRAYAQLEATWQALAGHEGTIYVPNAKPSGPVDYILVTMEPSMRGGGGSAAGVRAWIANGGRNFHASDKVDYLLHWAVRLHLCSPGQTYHITDVSKGAMLTKDAGKEREERWNRWWPSLQQEIALLSKPAGATKLIAVGGLPEEYLRVKGRPPDLGILSFSGTARGVRKTRVEPHKAEFAKFAETFTLNDIIRVADQAMTAAGIPDAMREAALENLRAAHLPDSDKWLAFIYMRAFTDFKRLQDEKMTHGNG